MKKTNKKVDKISNEYEAIIKILGKEYKSKGSTIEEAISSLKPQNCKGKAILSIIRGDVRKDRILMPTAIFRLFNTRGITREVAVKQSSLLFQGI